MQRIWEEIGKYVMGSIFNMSELDTVVENQVKGIQLKSGTEV